MLRQKGLKICLAIDNGVYLFHQVSDKGLLRRAKRLMPVLP